MYIQNTRWLKFFSKLFIKTAFPIGLSFILILHILSACSESGFKQGVKKRDGQNNSQIAEKDENITSDATADIESESQLETLLDTQASEADEVIKTSEEDPDQVFTIQEPVKNSAEISEKKETLEKEISQTKTKESDSPAPTDEPASQKESLGEDFKTAIAPITMVGTQGAFTLLNNRFGVIHYSYRSKNVYFSVLNSNGQIIKKITLDTGADKIFQKVFPIEGGFLAIYEKQEKVNFVKVSLEGELKATQALNIESGHLKHYDILVDSESSSKIYFLDSKSAVNQQTSFLKLTQLDAQLNIIKSQFFYDGSKEIYHYFKGLAQANDIQIARYTTQKEDNFVVQHQGALSSIKTPDSISTTDQKIHVIPHSPSSTPYIIRGTHYTSDISIASDGEKTYLAYYAGTSSELALFMDIYKASDSSFEKSIPIAKFNLKGLPVIGYMNPKLAVGDHSIGLSYHNPATATLQAAIIEKRTFSTKITPIWEGSGWGDLNSIPKTYFKWVDGSYTYSYSNAVKSGAILIDEMGNSHTKWFDEKMKFLDIQAISSEKTAYLYLVNSGDKRNDEDIKILFLESQP